VGQYAAIKGAFGIGLCMFTLARRDGLVEILPGALKVDVAMWLVMHEDQRTKRRVRLLYDFLAGALSAYAARSLPLRVRAGEREGTEHRVRLVSPSKSSPRRSARAGRRSNRTS